MASPNNTPSTPKEADISSLNKASLTPMLRQYKDIKARHQDCILFFRLGDFYEMFFEDAKTVSRELDLILTSRGKTPEGKIPMCGFPHHAADNYIARLVKQGYKIAICEQMENPAETKGIVKRDIIRVITSGTYLDDDSSDARYILSVFPQGKACGFAFTDPSTGTIQTNQWPLNENRIIDFVSRLPVRECIFPESLESQIRPLFLNPLLRAKNITLSPYQDWAFNKEISGKNLREHFGVHNLNGFGIQDFPDAVCASGALLEYLKDMNRQPLKHIDKLSLYTSNDYLYISPAAARGLELEELIRHLNLCLCPLGKRKFHFWFHHPLKKAEPIQQRQEAVALLKEDDLVLKELRIHLSSIPDIEKSLSRLSCGCGSIKDIVNIQKTLTRLPDILSIISPLKDQNPLFAVSDIPDLRELLNRVISDEIPLAKPEGKIVKHGFHPELDALRAIQQNGREWLKNFQEQEIKKTGINSLKVGFNKVFGYYIEVTKTNLSLVPEHYIRKQTLVSAERFITQELKEYEEKILTAQDKIQSIETQVIKDVLHKMLTFSADLHRLCNGLAVLDCLYALSVPACSADWCRPLINDTDVIDIRDGRHPVVEKNLTETFVSNDTYLDGKDQHLIILTGPNMAGKSTYIRQSAILVLMAQTGSFLPAKSAAIGMVDKIFTRIGAHDDIAKGQSTFMVEMNETADILNNMTDKSLVILDEIGRGTSTYDGLSLAWSLAEHFQHTRTRTLFATHFHELTAIADKFPGVKNYNVAVKEWKDEVVFLHKIIPGSSDDSYGIYVAKLAGIPAEVIQRAKTILTQLEMKNDIKENLKKDFHTEEQLSLFTAKKDPALELIAETIRALDVNALTPLEALNKMQELKNNLDK